VEQGLGWRIEWNPVAERMIVSGDGWFFIAEDDGGLVVRERKSGMWRSGARVVSIECKSWVGGIYGVRTVAQHVAELLGGM
jgi:hypothetical protein